MEFDPQLSQDPNRRWIVRAAWLGVVVAVGLMFATAGTAQVGQATPGQPVAVHVPSGEGGLIAVPCQGGEAGPLVAVIDTKTRVLSVYRIDGASGKVALCSVRNINWDLQMTEYNSALPLPGEIRALLEQR